MTLNAFYFLSIIVAVSVGVVWGQRRERARHAYRVAQEAAHARAFGGRR
jgi:hypothetical protein